MWLVLAVQMEEGLLEELFARRRNINASENLGVLYEIRNGIVKNQSLQYETLLKIVENHMNRSTDVLHRYLTLIIEYDNTEQRKDDAASRMKVVKELYVKGCVSQIKLEEKESS